MSDQAFTNQEKLTCVKRELGLRRRAYPRWVGNGTMRQSAADREVALMEAIIADYEKLVEAEKAAGRLL
jgi:hypothetical protein